MDKLFAIQRPDGTVVQAEPSHGESRAWFNAYVAECPSQMNNMAHAKSLGYRCVEVKVVPVEQAERVCVWRRGEFIDDFTPGCSPGTSGASGGWRYAWSTGFMIIMTFCPHCGGKIKEAGK